MRPDNSDGSPAGRSTEEAVLRSLLVDVSGKPGGAERSLELLVRSLTALGVNCALVGAGGVRPEACDGSDMPFFRTCSFEPARRPGFAMGIVMFWRWVICILAVASAIVRFRPSIVHANTTGAALVSVLPAWLIGRPLVWHVRDLVPLGMCGRFLAARSSKIIVVSNAVREDLVQQGIANDEIVVVHNGVDVSQAAIAVTTGMRGHLRDQLGFPASAFVYVNIGRWLTWKKQGLFVKAAGQLAKYYPLARFVIVGGEPSGGGGCKRELEEQIRQVGLTDCCVLLDWQEDVGEILAGADALVHTASREPFGRVLIEAMVAGVPVVAVSSGGPAEIIETKKSGLLVEADDVDGLVAAMSRLQADSPLVDRLRSGGRERVLRRFTAERVGRDVREVYRRVLGMSAHRVCAVSIAGSEMMSG